MEERVREIHTVIADWLKFAEAKNAALVALDVGIIFGLVQSLGKHPEDMRMIDLYVFAVLSFTFASAIVGVVSFLPQVRIPWIRILASPNASDNLLFFGDIQKYNVDGYLRAVSESVGEERVQFSRFERMYAQQIIVNSRIASRKFTYFRYAIWALLSGILTPVLCFFVYRIVRENQSE